MDDEEDIRQSWFRERMGVIIGVIGLIAWFALVWLMFGDVV